MGVSQLMTNLDLEMIGPTNIAPCDVPDIRLKVRNGADVSDELGGRKLLHFLIDEKVGAYRHGTDLPIFTTPTPYPADDVIEFLALPAAYFPRRHALILDPMKLHSIAGPRFVRWGSGIEYILLQGFGEDAIDSKWEVKL